MPTDQTSRYKLAIIIVVAVLAWSLFVYLLISRHSRMSFQTPESTTDAALPIPARVKILDISLPAIHPTITNQVARVTAASAKILEYAHGTVSADGKLFIGMASKAGNPFPTNEIVIFDDPTDLARPTLVSLRAAGDIETMTYDAKNDKIYFVLSSNSALDIYALDPITYAVWPILATTTVDAGPKPAIVTDGTYIYGITNTDPSKVFRVTIHTGEFTVNDVGHIPNGHSAAIGIFASSTELYFAGGTSNGFEKTDAATLTPLATEKIEPCDMSDDMPFQQTSAHAGYVYVGCERVPYGVRFDTRDLSSERFSLPGASLGMFIFGRDLYNAATDRTVDVFPDADLGVLTRYKVIGDAAPFAAVGPDEQVNEILFSPSTGRAYITAWWGIPGLFEVATST